MNLNILIVNLLKDVASKIDVKSALYIGLNSLIIGILLTGCGGSGNSKRNSRELFTLEINDSYCGINIKKSFTSQQLLCENIAYELSRRSCAQIQYQRAYNDNNCHRITTTGDIDLGVPIVGSPVTIPGGSGEIPQVPIVDIDYTATDQAYIEMMIALDRYYTVDSSGCIATVTRNGAQFDLCYIEGLEDHWSGDLYDPQKDDPETANPAGGGERATPRAPRLTETPAPSEDDRSPAPVGRTEEPAPAPAADLDYNLVYFNEGSTRYEARTDNRLPFLSITARVDQGSPISGLVHTKPSDFLNASIIGQETACPSLRAQISSTANNVLVAILSVSREANSAQIESCRGLILSLSTAQTFELEIQTPMIFENNVTIPNLIRFQNQ